MCRLPRGHEFESHFLNRPHGDRMLGAKSQPIFAKWSKEGNMFTLCATQVTMTSTMGQEESVYVSKNHQCGLVKAKVPLNGNKKFDVVTLITLLEGLDILILEKSRD